MDNKSLNEVDTIILGAGISGLTLGYYLNNRDKDFLVFESSKYVGGNISTKNKKGFICENGPNTVLINNESLRDLISDLKIKNDVIYPNNNNNKRFLIKKGKLIKIPQSFGQFIKSNLLSLSAKIRVFFEIFIKKSKSNLSVYDFFKRRFGKEFHDILIEPFLTGIYAGNTRKMSIKHVLKKIWKVEQNYGSVILGFIKKKSRNRIPKSFNFKNGLSDLTNTIHLKIKDKIRFESKITSISKIGNLYEITVNNDIRYRCNKLISTIPAYALSEVIFDKKLSQALKKIFYCPIYVLHLGLEKQKIKKDISGFGVLTKPSDNKNFLGIIFNSRIFPHVAPVDKDLMTVMVGGTRQEQLLKTDKGLLFDEIIKDIRKLISYNGSIIMKHDFLWSKGIPQYGIDHDYIINEIKNFENKNKNFHIIGNYFNGISVSDCIEKASRLSKIL
tara:strand:- start:337 stop:1668 length:1332 start_codon:yes stop_codon:yes gene_type:complete